MLCLHSNFQCLVVSASREISGTELHTHTIRLPVCFWGSSHRGIISKYLYTNTQQVLERLNTFITHSAANAYTTHYNINIACDTLQHRQVSHNYYGGLLGQYCQNIFSWASTKFSYTNFNGVCVCS